MAGEDKKEQERNQRGSTNESQDPEDRPERTNAREGRGMSDIDHKSRGHQADHSPRNDPDNGTQGRNQSDSR